MTCLLLSFLYLIMPLLSSIFLIIGLYDISASFSQSSSSSSDSAPLISFHDNKHHHPFIPQNGCTQALQRHLLPLEISSISSSLQRLHRALHHHYHPPLLAHPQTPQLVLHPLRRRLRLFVSSPFILNSI